MDGRIIKVVVCRLRFNLKFRSSAFTCTARLNFCFLVKEADEAKRDWMCMTRCAQEWVDNANTDLMVRSNRKSRKGRRAPAEMSHLCLACVPPSPI